MVRQLAADAIRIKMKAKKESPLISVYEFCYAAGLSARMMDMPRSRAEELIQMDSFADFKKQIQELAKASGLFAGYPDGERLQHLVVSCRHKGQMDEDARALFEMGYQSSP